LCSPDDARLSFFAPGLAVAHYKTPMGEVLEMGAATLEKAAKAYDKDKDAFATAVLKHSGPKFSKWTFKWRECSENEAIFGQRSICFHNIMKPVANGLFHQNL
jgi:CRISPR/Cas system-associated protein Cas10 (large subunit of type III CRISPR-Cas system)